MSMDGSLVTTGIAVGAGKEIVTTAIKSMAKIVETSRKSLNSAFKIEGEQMTVLCSESIQKCSLSLTPLPKTMMAPKFVDFKSAVPIRAQIIQTRSLNPVQGAIEIINDGYRINMTKLNENELYILDTEYRLDNVNFIDSLVERSIPRDVPHNSDDGIKAYEMSAQLKHLGALKQKYYSVNLRDVDFAVNVAVHQDVSTTIPGNFRKQLEAFMKLSKKSGRSKQFKDLQRYRQLQQTKHGDKSFEILDDLHDIFSPTKFKNFIDVINDFHYSGCERGRDFYDTPFPTWPRTMKVISRTDLNLDKPAADGKVLYKHNNFITEIEKIFDYNKNLN